MALITTDEQEALRDVMRGFLQKFSTESDVRTVMDGESGYDAAAWRTAAEQIGVQGLAIPEEMGGGGYGFDELAIVMEEAGRTLFPSPLLSTAVLATSTLLSVGGPQAAEYLARIAGGDLIATVAVSEAKLHWDPDDITTVASESGGRWALTGTKPYVLDGAQADVILVAARTTAGVSLFAVESGADGLSVDPLDSMDQTRRMAAVGFSKTPAVLLGDDGSGWDTLSSVYDRALAALACEQVGRRAGRAGDDRGVPQCATPVRAAHRIVSGDQASMRRPAGGGGVRPVGGRVRQRAVATGADDASVAASIAKVYCSQAFYHVAAESIQMHGGIGFTWEHPAHLYFKRAKSSEALFGWPADHRDRIATLIGLI